MGSNARTQDFDHSCRRATLVATIAFVNGYGRDSRAHDVTAAVCFCSGATTDIATDVATVIGLALGEGGQVVEHELTIIVAPVVLGGGKRLFEGFTRSFELEHLGVRQSSFATFIDYRVTRS